MKSSWAHGSWYKHFKMLIFAWKIEWYHRQQEMSVVFLELTGSIYSFLRKKSAKYPSLNIQFVCQLFFQEAMMSHKKVASLACYSNNCTSVFPQENHSVLGCNESLFCELPILSYRTQKTCTQRLRVNKLITLVASPWVKLAFFFFF